jgi:hypothetical protein
LVYEELGHSPGGFSQTPEANLYKHLWNTKLNNLNLNQGLAHLPLSPKNK